MPHDVPLAAIIGAHGLKGEVKAKTFTQSPDALARYGALHLEDGRAIELVRVQPTKPGEAILTIKGVNDRNAAEALKGQQLLVPRTALPEPEAHEFYHADLIGLRAEDELGRVLGTVHAVHNFGAGDVIEIRRTDGDDVLIAFTRENVPAVEPQNGRIIVAVPEEIDTAIWGNVE